MARSDGPRRGGRTACRRAGSQHADSRNASIWPSFSRGRDRAGRVDQVAAGPHHLRAALEDRRLQHDELVDVVRLLRQRASGRDASVPRSEHGGSTRTRSYAPRGARRRRRCGPSTHVAPMRLAVRRSASARPSWRSTAMIWPSLRISAARWVVLPPGAAQRSRTVSPGRGSSARATACAARDCGMNSPSCHSGEANASNGRVEQQRVGQIGRLGGAARRARAGVVLSVLARTAASAGSLFAAIRARASSAPSASNHSSAIHSGCEWRSAASRASGRAARRSAAAPRWPRAQDRVDEAGAAAAAPWRARPTRRRRRAPAHGPEGELEHTEPQRREHGWLELRGRPPGERLDHVVERSPCAARRRTRAASRGRGRGRRVALRASPCSARSAYAPSSKTRLTTAYAHVRAAARFRPRPGGRDPVRLTRRAAPGWVVSAPSVRHLTRAGMLSPGASEAPRPDSGFCYRAFWGISRLFRRVSNVRPFRRANAQF